MVTASARSVRKLTGFMINFCGSKSTVEFKCPILLLGYSYGRINNTFVKL